MSGHREVIIPERMARRHLELRQRLERLGLQWSYLEYSRRYIICTVRGAEYQLGLEAARAFCAGAEEALAATTLRATTGGST